jgi:hypothetical protein
MANSASKAEKLISDKRIGDALILFISTMQGFLFDQYLCGHLLTVFSLK